MSLWFARTVRLAICCKWLPLSIFCYADSSMSMASTRCAEFFESIFAFNLKIYGLSVLCVCVVFGLFDKQKLSFHIKKKKYSKIILMVFIQMQWHVCILVWISRWLVHCSLNQNVRIVKLNLDFDFYAKYIWFFFLALLNWFPEFINKINMKYMRKHMWL